MPDDQHQERQSTLQRFYRCTSGKLSMQAPSHRLLLCRYAEFIEFRLAKA